MSARKPLISEMKLENYVRDYLTTLSGYLVSSDRINEAVKDRHAVADEFKSKRGSNATLEDAKAGFDEKTGNSNTDRVYFDRKRVSELSHLYLIESKSDREKIAFSSVFIAAGFDANMKFTPGVQSIKNRQKQIAAGEQLKSWLDTVSMVTARELHDVVGFETKSGYTVNSAMWERMSNPETAKLISMTVACEQQLKSAGQNILKKVQSLGGKVKDLDGALAWVEETKKQPKTPNGFAGLDTLIKNYDELKKLHDVISPGSGKPSPHDRYNNYLAAMKEYRDDYKKAHQFSTDMTHFFKTKINDPVYALWRESVKENYKNNSPAGKIKPK